MCRQEFDRLMETSPSINDNVIKEFKHKFSGKLGSEKRRKYNNLRKPDICDTIVSVDETRHKWYEDILDVSSDLSDQVDQAEIRSKDNYILEQQLLIQEKEAEISRHNEMQQASVRVKLANVERITKQQRVEEELYQERIVTIVSYVTGYSELYNRKPTTEELRDNFGNELGDELLDKFISSYDPSSDV